MNRNEDDVSEIPTGPTHQPRQVEHVGYVSGKGAEEEYRNSCRVPLLAVLAEADVGEVFASNP